MSDWLADLKRDVDDAWSRLPASFQQQILAQNAYDAEERRRVNAFRAAGGTIGGW